jgi:hypothetical protein
MSSDNPTSADNQQERHAEDTWMNAIPADVGNYIAGFVDGEGSFNVPIRRSSDRSLPWRVGLSFNVSQVGPEQPRMLRGVFGAGTVRGRSDGVYYFEVTRPEELRSRVFPFFERFPLRGPKLQDLAIFCEITSMVLLGAHLSVSGFTRILELRGPMNRGGKRRRTDDELVRALPRHESSETIRKAPLEAGG